MAGIYIHVPFCRKICHYCDFYKIMYNDKVKDLVSALMIEMELRQAYLQGEKVETIYFGGGTPSVLQADDIIRIIGRIRELFKVSGDCEITIEVNPDDLSADFLRTIKDKASVNRLSIGVQSFCDDDLQFLNRRHNARQSLLAIDMALEAGFGNISIDLIYGIPGLTDKKWIYNLKTAFSKQIQHFSAYHLTIERNTDLYKQIVLGKTRELDEEGSIIQYENLCKLAAQAGFIHYEISNFSRDGYCSLHNSNYWTRKSYLGLGPSAHSYNGCSRQWNIASLNEYLAGIRLERPCFKMEMLDETMKFNEYVLLSLRTNLGLSVERLHNEFGKLAAEKFIKEAAPFVERGQMEKRGKSYVMNEKSWFISDNIISNLMQDVL